VLSVAIEGSGSDTTSSSQFSYMLQAPSQWDQTNVSVRLYFTLDGSQLASNYCIQTNYQTGNATVSGPTQFSGNVYYFNFDYGAGVLPRLDLGATPPPMWTYQGTLSMCDHSANLDVTNDWWHTGYAMGALPATFTSTNYIPAYVHGILAAGNEPSGGGPTPTVTKTPTITATYTRTLTPTATTFTNTPTRTPTAGFTFTPTATPTKTSTPAITATPTKTMTPTITLTPGGGGSCTVITGNGSYPVTTTATCFKLVNAGYSHGALWSIANGNGTMTNTIQWYGGTNESVTSCVTNSQQLIGNGAQLNNITVAKDSNSAMFVTVTGSVANTINFTSIQNWQNGSGCSVAPTPSP
jgi:hypothetical protein